MGKFAHKKIWTVIKAYFQYSGAGKCLDLILRSINLRNVKIYKNLS